MDALKLLSRSTGLKPGRAKTTHTLHTSHETSSAAPRENGSHLGKRKRGAGDVAANSKPLTELSEQDIRKIQKAHRIKIVDLNSLRTPGEPLGSRKSQKDSCRVFPRPMTNFSQLRLPYNVNHSLLQNVHDQGYVEPTEVQVATLPLLLPWPESNVSNEPDILTIAPTGSGKTLAFMIPLVEKIAKSHQLTDSVAGKDRHISAIVLAPTKELVSQIVNEGRKLVSKTGVTIAAFRKGMELVEGQMQGDPEQSVEEEDSDIDAPHRRSNGTISSDSPPIKVDILVSTPLSLVHAITRPSSDLESPSTILLPKITNLVLDEADVLLDPLFRDQTLSIWASCTSRNLRTSLWSATIGSNVEELAVQTINTRHSRLGIKQGNRPQLLRVIIGLKDISLPSISHRLTYVATESGKLLGMRQLIRPSRSPASGASQSVSAEGKPLRPPFLVFTQTIDRAQSLYKELQYDIPAAAGGNSRIAVLHSSLPASKRSAIMTQFRQGKIWILITTDLLSRGVDFQGVNVVVNYDIPTTVAAYVHRAGRTGRGGREGGVCISFYTKEDIPYVKGIANVVAASEKARTRSPERSADSANTASLPPQSPLPTSSAPATDGIPPWLLAALPTVSKSSRKSLKAHGIESRRAIHADDDEKTRRAKRKARIGTASGFEKREANRKQGAVEGSKRRRQKERENDRGGWSGFD